MTYSGIEIRVGTYVKLRKPSPGVSPYGTVIDNRPLQGRVMVRHERSFWAWLWRKPAPIGYWAYHEVEVIGWAG